MHIIFPSDILNPKEPDAVYLDQVSAFEAAGFTWSLCSIEEIVQGKKGLRGEIPPDSLVMYRGWMLTPSEYRFLLEAVIKSGGKPLTDLETYLKSHYLPNWYPLIKEYTPETLILQETDNLEAELLKLDWDGFFIKDYVKSLKTSVGSIIRDPKDITIVVAEMKKYRGTIEGGICIRRVEEFEPDTEVRYFVINGTPYSPDPNQPVPDIVTDCASKIPSPFFSVDVIRRTDGCLRVVEIGDGQVSDIVGWSAERLTEACRIFLP